MPVNNHILLIDDDRGASEYLGQKLMDEAAYAVSYEYTSQGGLMAAKENKFDIVIAKFGLADLNGVSLIQEIKKIDPDCVIVVLVKENEDPFVLREISELGIYDIVTIPVNLEKLFFLVKKGMQLRFMANEHRRMMQIFSGQNNVLQRQNILLAKRIEDSAKNLTRLYEDLRSTYMRTIRALAQAIDARDHYTHSHSENVAKIAVAIAEEMGLSVKDIEIISQACELHDIGKIGIEDNILTKPSSLTSEEWQQVKRHPVTGAQILEPLTFLQDVVEIVRQHHEHYDGSGYPAGRRGEDIILGARIIHLADAYEAMRSERAYRKKPLTKEEAISEINTNSGSQFDPKVVEVFLRIVDHVSDLFP
jgi:putative nucleotidyltransferase with HDIG domain